MNIFTICYQNSTKRYPLESQKRVRRVRKVWSISELIRISSNFKRQFKIELKRRRIVD